MKYIQFRSRLTEFISRQISVPAAVYLYQFNFGPNHLTVMGTACAGLAAVFIMSGWFLFGGLLFLIACLFDVMDGTLARMIKQETPFGAFLDSTLDKVVEGLVFCGIAYYYAAQGEALMVGISVALLMIFFLISYVRLYSKKYNVDCNTGLVTRPERILLLAAGLILNLVPFMLLLLFILSTITLLQRIIYIGNALRE